MNWKSVKNLSNTNFRRMVGVERSTFEIMSTGLKPAWNQKLMNGGPGPKRKSSKVPTC